MTLQQIEATDRFVAGSRLNVMIRSRGAVATETVLDRAGKLASNVRHGKDTEGRVRWRPFFRGRLSFGNAAVGEHRYKDVFQIGRRFRVREAETSGQVCTGMDQKSGRQNVEVATSGRCPTAKRDFDVGRHRAIVLANPGDVRHELVGVGDGRSALDRQEIAESEGCEPGNEVHPKHVPLLNFDVQPRWRENVVGDKAQVVEIADTDAWNDVTVSRQADATSCRGDVQYLGAGWIRRTGGDEHYNGRCPIVRHNHLPDRWLGQGDVGQLVPVAVALEETGAGKDTSTTAVNHEGLVDGVRERLQRLGTVRTEALALTGRRWTHGVVQSWSRVDSLFNLQILRQLKQAVRGANIHLQ